MPIVLMRNGAIYKPERDLHYGGAIYAIDDSLSSKITSVIKPDNTVVDAPTFVFHCNSVPKTGKVYIDQDIDNSGSGSETDPWHDLNYALKYITCLIDSTCSYDNYAFIIKLSGTVNYYIGSGVMAFNDSLAFNGRGLVTIDCTDAVFRYTDMFPAYIEILHGVNFLNMDIEGNVKVENVASRSLTVIEELFNCRIQFKRIKFSFEAETITNTTSVTGISNCYNSFFYGGEVEVSSSGECKQADIAVAGVSVCSDCYFSVKKITLDCSKTTVYMGVYIGAYGFVSTENCILQDCYVTFNGVERHSAGCAFSRNVNTTWLGENIGFRLTQDIDGNQILLPDSLINENCEDAPIEPSSGESSSAEPPSSPYEPPSHDGSDDESSEPSEPSDASSEEASSIIPPSSAVPPSSVVPPSSAVPPSEDIVISPVKGRIMAYPFSRSTSFRLLGKQIVQETDACIYYVYVTSIAYNWEYRGACTANRIPEREWSKNYGRADEVPGEMIEMGEDENGNPVKECVYWEEYPCTSANFAEAVPAAIRSGNADITKWINGTLKEFPLPTDIPIGGNQEWTGFSNYYRCGSLGYINPTILKDGGEKLIHTTKTSVGYYSTWGETPCTWGDGSAEIVIDTVVFKWEASDYNNPENVKPKYVAMESANGKLILCELDKEYCLMGNAYVDREMLTLTSCQVADAELDCPFVVIKGTTSEYNCNQSTLRDCDASDLYRKPENHITTTFTYKGVVY